MLFTFVKKRKKKFLKMKIKNRKSTKALLLLSLLTRTFESEELSNRIHRKHTAKVSKWKRDSFKKVTTLTDTGLLKCCGLIEDFENKKIPLKTFFLFFFCQTKESWLSSWRWIFLGNIWTAGPIYIVLQACQILWKVVDLFIPLYSNRHTSLECVKRFVLREEYISMLLKLNIIVYK